MLQRISEGHVPPKHHMVHPRNDGGVHYEQCLTRRGFDGPYSILYHQNPPHHQRPAATRHGWLTPRAEGHMELSKRHFRTQVLPSTGGAPVDARRPILFNEDVVISVLKPDAPDPVYFSNGDGDDLFFVLEGGGFLHSAFGVLRFDRHDYVCVPKGVVHRFRPDEGVKQHWLSIE